MSTMVQFRGNADKIYTIPYYQHSSKPKGLALVINNYNFKVDGEVANRRGSEWDFAATISLLEELSFEITAHWNLTAQGMVDAVKDFLSLFATGEYHSCVVVLMTHGCLGHFVGSDVVKVKEIDIIQLISKSRHLRGKPKIIFIQCCRDKVPLPGDDSTDDQENQAPPPAQLDMFIFHSTLPGQKSRRDASRLGSWFIRALCKIVGQYAHEGWAHLLAMAPRVVNEVLADRRAFQQPIIVFNSTKRFHFFPVEEVFAQSGLY